MQPIKIQLSKKLKVFPELLTEFLKSSFNFDHFEKKDESHSLCISKIIDGETRTYVNV